ncbi:hybrid sensor histidine kinase/response regulator [Desulfopila inferna]|uniref:hybrid sensor histidine kinase/response regulator n=1 Tax=Desulfopila inferna TaxID=468528 RepID=UPI001963315C|nr:PAS domain S-box protein [Desulfopila inferna]MBM9606451.1 PAS domain S-box protein [Desulfopila inferna]
MSSDGHYLKDELYNLIKTDSSIFEFLQKGSLDGIWYWDLEEPDNEWMSPQFWKTLGYDPQEKKHFASEWQELINQDDLNTAIANFQRHCDDPNHPYDQVVRYQHKNGSTIWVRCRGIAIRNESGKPVRMLGAHNELTQLKKAEEEVRENEKRYRSHFLHFPVPIFVWKHQDGKFVLSDYNEEAETITDGEAAKIIGITADQLYNDENSSHLIDTLLDCFHQKRTIRKEFKYRLKTTGEVKSINGTWIFVSPDTVMLHTEDITDRKRIEEGLGESKTFLENITDIAYLADDKGNVLWVNRAAERVTGLPPEAIIDKPFLPLFMERDHTSLMDVYKRTLKGESLESTLTFKSGVICHFSSLPKYNKKGEIVGTFGVARNISEWHAAERALQTSEARLKRAQTMAKVGNWEYDIVTGRVWASEEAFSIYGIERTSEFLPLDEVENYIVDAKRVKQALVDLLAQNKTYNIEFQVNPKNGKELIHVHSAAELIYDNDGNPVKVAGVIQDITEAKQAEEILHKSHEMLKRTEAMASIGSWEWDVQHDRASWSEELFRIFGLDPAEGAPSFADQSELYAKGDIQRLSDAVEICVKQGRSYEIEVRAVRTDGEIRHCISRGQPQYDENGKVFRIAGSFQDITKRKQTELALKESEERFKALHNASFGGIAIHEQGLILECNKGLSEITGYGYEELIGMDGLQLISDDTRDMVIQYIKTGYEKPYEAKGVRKNGEIYPLRLQARNIPFKGNNVRVVEFRDISENKRTEKEREELEGKLRQAQKMEAVGRLAGGVAHDFNNMLSVIIGHADMAMEDMDSSEPVYDRLKEIKKAGERSSDLTRQLLGFARKQTVSPKVLDLNKTVKSMTSMLHRLIGEDIDLAWLPGDNVWPVKVDPSQIDQILANLCVNARDAIADVGKVTIETGNTSFDETYCSDHPGFNPGEYVLLAVSDGGCGMDSETLDNIFEPFFTTKESGRGTGLGLATVYGVVKQNEGFIRVYSEPGEGTTFNIYLPRYRSKTEALPDKVKDLPTELGYETILLVEDEIAILRMTAQMLQRQGYKVITARTPGEAICLSLEHAGDIHLLVTDVVMPEMNGRDLAKNILSIYPNLNRLFMSGYTANVIAHHGILDEGINFIQKPFSREQLGRKVREVLDKGKG